MGKPTSSNVEVSRFFWREARLGELNHLSNSRKRKRSHSRSSGERNGKSLNPGYVIARMRCSREVVGDNRIGIRTDREVTNSYL